MVILDCNFLTQVMRAMLDATDVLKDGVMLFFLYSTTTSSSSFSSKISSHQVLENNKVSKVWGMFPSHVQARILPLLQRFEIAFPSPANSTLIPLLLPSAQPPELFVIFFPKFLLLVVVVINSPYE